MQLKVTTDYAIRIVLYAAMKKEIVSSRELSENLCIAQSIVLKEGRKLSEYGILKVTAGAHGGFCLGRDPKEISLFEIIDLFEPTTRINRCLEEDEYCSRHAAETCPVRKAYGKIQQQLESGLKAVTIQSLLEE